MILSRIAPLVLVAAIAAACGGQVTADDGSASSANSGGSTCKAAGGFCLTHNSPSAKGQGPASCGQLAQVDSPLACDTGHCCMPPPPPVACLDFPDEAPKCSGAEANAPLAFATLAELQDFLRGNWSMCAFDRFVGGFTDFEGLMFSGSGSTFEAHAITWLDGVGRCDVVNDDKHHRPTQFDIAPLAPDSDHWFISITMPSLAQQTVSSINLSPPRLRLASGVTLERVSPR